MTTASSANQASFDPYHEWLGISPQHQPAHAYRLVGVSPFERDPDVISTAAQMRLTYLARQQQTPRAPQAKQLQLEVREALEMLLDPQQRSEYEQELALRWGVSIGAGLAFDHPTQNRRASDSASASQASSAVTRSGGNDDSNPLPPHLRTARGMDRGEDEREPRARSFDQSTPPLAQPPSRSPIPPHLAAGKDSANRSATATQSNSPAPTASPSSFSTGEGDAGVGAGFQNPELSRPMARVRGGRGAVSKQKRYIAAVVVALIFLPIHALLGFIGYQLANRSPQTPTSGGSAPAVINSPEDRSPKSPEAGKGIEFAPGNSLEWPEISRWYRDPSQGTFELWATVNRTTGFVPLFGVYRDGTAFPERSASTAQPWIGWVVGLSRTAQQGNYQLEYRRQLQDKQVTQSWPLAWRADERVPHHLAVVINGPRVTMLLDGKQVGEISDGAISKAVADGASFWIGSGKPFQEAGAWRGVMLDMRVSQVARPIVQSGARAQWTPDDQTLCQFARNVSNSADPTTVRDASRNQLRGSLTGGKWIDWSP